jgi:hypothetical protein
MIFNPAKMKDERWNMLDPANRAKLRVAIQELAFNPIENMRHRPQARRQLIEVMTRARIQELESSADFATLIKGAVGSIIATGDLPDEGYRLLFQFRDDVGRATTGFIVHNVVSGLTWDRYVPGTPIVPTKVTGTDITVSYDKVISSLHEYKYVDFLQGNWYTIQNEAEMQRMRYYIDKAVYFYGLIEATSRTQAYVTSGLTYQYEKDCATMDTAVQTVIAQLKAYGVNARTRLYLLAPEGLRQRITAALAVVPGAAPNLAYSVQAYNLTPIFSNNLASSSYYYVCCPGLTAQAGEQLPMTISDPQVDITKAGGIVAVAGNAIYAGAIGNDYQFIKCSIA